MWCRVADESAVVINLRPMKAGNSIGGENRRDTAPGCGGAWKAKSPHACEGAKANRSFATEENGDSAKEKTTEAEMPRGTLEPGVTNLLVLPPAPMRMYRTNRR